MKLKKILIKIIFIYSVFFLNTAYSEYFLQTYIHSIELADYPLVRFLMVIRDFEKQKTICADKSNCSYYLEIKENGKLIKDFKLKHYLLVNPNIEIVSVAFRSKASRNATRKLKIKIGTNGIHNYKGEDYQFLKSDAAIFKVKSYITSGPDFAIEGRRILTIAKKKKRQTQASVKGISIGDNVNVREGKGFQYRVIDSLKKWEEVTILKIDQYTSGSQGILRKASKVRIKGKIYCLQKGKALTITQNRGKYYRVLVDLKGKKRILKLKKNMVMDIVGFVKIKTKQGNIGWAVLKYVREYYYARDAKEFVKSLGPNRVIEMGAHDIVLSDLSKESRSDYYQFVTEYVDQELHIENISNLIIKGIGAKHSRILTRPQFGNVLVFKNCNNITLENIQAGHAPEPGFCSGGVLKFHNCKNIKIKDCILFGSGTEGLYLDKVTGLTCKKCTIKDCTYNILSVYSSKNILFDACKFLNNKSSVSGLINVASVKRLVIRNTLIHANGTPNISSPRFLFEIGDRGNVMIENCRIQYNKVEKFTNNKKMIKLKKVVFKNNSFDN